MIYQLALREAGMALVVESDLDEVRFEGWLIERALRLPSSPASPVVVCRPAPEAPAVDFTLPGQASMLTMWIHELLAGPNLATDDYWMALDGEDGDVAIADIDGDHLDARAEEIDLAWQGEPHGDFLLDEMVC